MCWADEITKRLNVTSGFAILESLEALLEVVAGPQQVIIP